MTRKLVIFGTGSFAEVARFLFEKDAGREVVAFTAHADHIEAKEFSGLPVVPFEDVASRYPPAEHDMFVAMGYRRLNRLRAQICAQAKERGYRLASYLSSKATHWGDVPIGENTFIFEDNTLQPFSRIGDNVILWSGNHIGHHAVIGDHCFITSHVVVSGHCRVGPYTFIGVNATLRDNISVGESCIIGAGALIMRSTGDREVYIERRTERDPRSSDEIEM